MTAAETAKLIVDIVTAIAARAPDVLEALDRDPDWQALVSKVGAASARKTETEQAAEDARRRLGGGS